MIIMHCVTGKTNILAEAVAFNFFICYSNLQWLVDLVLGISAMQLERKKLLKLSVAFSFS